MTVALYRPFAPPRKRTMNDATNDYILAELRRGRPASELACEYKWRSTSSVYGRGRKAAKREATELPLVLVIF